METSGTAHEHLRILDFGCGIGACEPYLAEYFPGADICAIDVSSESIALACERNQNLSNVQFSVFDGIQSPFSGTYDLIMMAGVLHHIDTAMRMKVLAGIRDVLSSRGRLFIFEHNPWNPLTRRIVRDCPFDDKADLVSPPAVADLLKKSGFVLQTLRFIYFFPYLLRLMVPMEKYLGMLPLGAQYYYVAGKQEI
jgi:SAM-dependent methyltransferase